MATFEFEGKPITVIAQHAATYGDLAFMKEHFDIAGLVELEQGMGEMEPVAWRAVLIASIRRVQPDISPTHAGIESVAILPLILEMNRERDERIAAEEEAKKARPTPAPRRRSSRARAGTSG